MTQWYMIPIGSVGIAQAGASGVLRNWVSHAWLQLEVDPSNAQQINNKSTSEATHHVSDSAHAHRAREPSKLRNALEAADHVAARRKDGVAARDEAHLAQVVRL